MNLFFKIMIKHLINFILFIVAYKKNNCERLLHIVPFREGPNEKPEGFAKQKQSAIFAMRHASQLVVHHPSLIYNVPLIIAALLRHIQQTKLCDPLNLRPP
jgi:hypothetical protein